MVSVKTLFLGPDVAFNSHLDVHSVIAHSERLTPIVDAVNMYIRSKHKRGRSEEEIVDKLEKLEQVYLHVTEVHNAFHIARAESGLPTSRVLVGNNQPYYHVPLRSSSPTPTYSTTTTAAHHSDALPSGLSTAAHSETNLITSSNTAPSNAPRRQSISNSPSWRRFLPANRRSSANDQSSGAGPPIRTAFTVPSTPSPASSVITLRAGGNDTDHTANHIRENIAAEQSLN